jgi:HK97 family phage major capsid protein
MPTSKELREKRAPLATGIRQQADKMNADGYQANAEDEANWKAVNDDYNRLTAQIERAEAADKVEADQTARLDGEGTGGALARGRLKPGLDDYRGTPNGDGVAALTGEAQRTLALAGWMKAYSESGMTDQEVEACRLQGVNPYAKGIRIPLFSTHDHNRMYRQFRAGHPTTGIERLADFRATLSGGAPTTGGNTIPLETLRTTLEVNMLYFGGVRQVAETIRTSSGEPLSWPTADDTSNTGVQLAESTTIGSSVDPSFGKIQWLAWKFSSKPIMVPYELIQDSVFNLPQVLGEMLGERLGRITNTKYTTGVGTTTPKGIVVAAGTFAAASATAITFDDIMGLQHSVDPAYRSGASYMMHDAILLVCRKLKDSTNQYLWQNGVQIGAPDRFVGQPLTINQDMDATVATTKKTILYGQLNKYKIRTVGEVRMYRLQERYRDLDQDAFIAFLREDGNLLSAGTNPVKVLAQP